MGDQIDISSNLTGSRDYLATLTASSSGNYTIDIAANKFTDDNGVDNLASTQFFGRLLIVHRLESIGSRY